MKCFESKNEEKKNRNKLDFVFLEAPCCIISTAAPEMPYKYNFLQIYKYKTFFWCKTNFSIPENVNCRISCDPD